MAAAGGHFHNLGSFPPHHRITDIVGEVQTICLSLNLDTGLLWRGGVDFSLSVRQSDSSSTRCYNVVGGSGKLETFHVQGNT
jgi:hypothetical protein